MSGRAFPSWPSARGCAGWRASPRRLGPGTAGSASASCRRRCDERGAGGRRMIKPKVLFTEGQIAQRLGELGPRIGEAYAGRELTVVGLMKGCLVFMAD